MKPEEFVGNILGKKVYITRGDDEPGHTGVLMDFDSLEILLERDASAFRGPGTSVLPWSGIFEISEKTWG